MILSLLARTLKEQIRFIILWLILDVLLTILCISSYLPGVRSFTIGMILSLPVQVKGLLGLGTCMKGLTGLFSGLMFGFLFPVLGTIQMIFLANRMILSAIEKGKLTLILSSPNSRDRIVNTFFIVLLIQSVLNGVVICISGMIFGFVSYGKEFSSGSFADLCTGYTCLLIFISSIAFYLSCRCVTSGKAYLWGFLFCFISFAILCISRGFSFLGFLKYISFYSLFAVDLIRQISVFGYAGMAVLIVLSVLIYAAGIFAFRKRDLVF